MTKLTNHITRETTLNGKQYYVTLDILDDEPVIYFKEKGRRGKNATRYMKPLVDILDQLTGMVVADSGMTGDQLAENLQMSDTFFVTHEESEGVLRSIKIEDDTGDMYQATVSDWKKA